MPIEWYYYKYIQNIIDADIKSTKEKKKICNLQAAKCFGFMKMTT